MRCRKRWIRDFGACRYEIGVRMKIQSKQEILCPKPGFGHSIKVQGILNGVVERSKECLDNNLIGVYLHGSLAMGCFNEESSDIDVLVVVNGAMTLEDKRCIGSSLMELIKKFSANKLELSIVTMDVLQNFHYPTPYELHFSNEHVDDFTGGEFDLMKQREDADLAAHFMIIKNRGICLYGEPISSIFPDITDEDYLKSIAQDFDWSYNNIMRGQEDGTCRVPVYAVLNACRMLAFIKDSLIASKTEGGQWAIEYLPKEYTSVIHEACSEYAKKSSSKEIDAKLLKQFIQYAKKEISRALEVFENEKSP